MTQYKKEHDGLVETRVEQKITIQSDGDPIDHDRALAEAIQVKILNDIWSNQEFYIRHLLLLKSFLKFFPKIRNVLAIYI